MKKFFFFLFLCTLWSFSNAKTYEVQISSFSMSRDSDGGYLWIDFHKEIELEVGDSDGVYLWIDFRKEIELEVGDIVTVIFDGTFSEILPEMTVFVMESSWTRLSSLDNKVTLGTTECNLSVDVTITTASSKSESQTIGVYFENKEQTIVDEEITFTSRFDLYSKEFPLMSNGILYNIKNKNEVSVAYYGEPVVPPCSEYRGDIVIPSTITTPQGNTFQVTSIDEDAFDSDACHAMYEFGPVYTEGRGVTSIAFPDNIKGINKAGIHFIKNGIWYRVLNNNDVCVAFSPSYTGDLIIPSTVSAGNTFTVKSIAQYAFASCSGVSSITIPESVTSIGDDAFWGCSNLSSATFGNVDVSRSGLTFTKNNITYQVLSNSEVAVSGSESTITDVSIPNTLTAGNIFAVKSIYKNAFANCKNIETVTIPDNMDVSKSGLTFTKDNITYKLLSNSEVAVCGAESTITDVTIPSTITAGMSFSVNSIETNAFSGCNNLKSVVIPETIKIIGESAFAGCSKLAKVTCMATTPPEANKNSFENYNGYLYFPCESKDDYDIDVCWGTFQHKECIASETVELTKDEVTVEPEKTEAVFSMPVNESANSYTLTIQNNGVTFCTLTFNAQGQLANIDFSTTKSYELKASVSGYQFTVTGLSEATNYGYSFKALASNKSVLKEYAGSFTTKNADGTGGSSSGGGEGTLAVDNVSVSNAITISNNQILVNGEAPAFVVTVSGQKIANANLKAGVYFVVAEGETVKVVVR